MTDEKLRSEKPPEEAGWREGRARGQDEKEEKEEKEEEKGEKEERWARDPLGSIIWALIFIAAGLILLAQSLGILRFEWQPFGGVWSLIFLAAGLLLVLEAVLRLVIPAYRRPVSGTLVFAFILLAIGLGGFFNWTLIGPLFLIAIGLAMIISGLLRGRI